MIICIKHGGCSSAVECVVVVRKMRVRLPPSALQKTPAGFFCKLPQNTEQQIQNCLRGICTKREKDEIAKPQFERPSARREIII